MKLDLAAIARRTSKGTTGKVRAEWTGGKFEIDEDAFVEGTAHAIAAAMGANLFAGRTPDGKGPMPGRRSDGRPRGMGSNISRSFFAQRMGKLEWRIAARDDPPGHLSRILKGVPFRSPSLERIRAAVDQAFAKCVKTGGGR